MSEDAEIPVCKIENHQLVQVEKKSKKKEIKAAEKARTVKEIFIAAGIASHDFDVKIAKLKEFIEQKHPVRIAIILKKTSLKKNPLGLEETTLQLLQRIENLPMNIQQSDQSGSIDMNQTAKRRDFIVTPLASSTTATTTTSTTNKEKTGKN